MTDIAFSEDIKQEVKHVQTLLDGIDIHLANIVERTRMNETAISDCELARDAVNKWGSATQMTMLQEECIELALAIHKWRNRETTMEALLKVAEEIADVELMLMQVKYMYAGHIPFSLRLEETGVAKRKRLRQRLDSGGNWL